MENFDDIVNEFKKIDCNFTPLKQSDMITRIALKYSLTWDRIMHFIDIDVLRFDNDLNIMVSNKITY